MKKEAWKTLPEFPDYKISSNGRILSLKRGTRKLLKPQTDAYGYFHVVLKGKTIKVHKLVTEAFLGKRPVGTVVCHNDGNAKNNSVTNLRYDSIRENILDIKRHGKENPPVGEKNGMAKLTWDQVREIRTRFDSERPPTALLAAIYRMSPRQIRDVVSRKCWKDPV